MKIALPKLLKRRWVLISLLVVGFVAIGLIAFVYMMRATSPLRDINSTEELRALFNRDKGVPRVILLMSPT